MTFAQAMQLLSVLGGLIVTGITSWRGYSAVMAKLQNYVTVDEYRAKTAALHSENNALHIRVAVLEDRAKR